MTTPYVGEIRMGGWNFAPLGWAFCDGSLLSIAQYTTLFTLIGTTYGGDGQTTFALPDLRGRVPLHRASGFAVGQTGGSEAVTLTAQQFPQHQHSFAASQNTAGQKNPAGNVPGTIAAGSAYLQTTPTAAMATQSIGQATAGSQPHENMQPWLGITFVISLSGIFPFQS